MKPVTIWRCSTILQHMVKLPEPATCMIEHTVKNQSDTAGVATIQQMPERGVTTKQRVNLIVVICMISMIAGRREDRTQIQSIDSQLGQIVELLRNTIERTTLEPVWSWSCIPVLKTWNPRCIGTTSEAIRKNLIENRSRHGPSPACRQTSATPSC